MTGVVIPIKLTKNIPDEPPMEVPNITNLPSFGTMAPDFVALHNSSGNKVAIEKKVQEEIYQKYKTWEIVIN